MAQLTKTATETIRGLVLPDQWDDDFDCVTAVVIDAEDGETYLITNEGPGKRLLDFTDRWVEAAGAVEEVDGELVMSVHRFCRIYEEDDHDYDRP